MNRTIYFQPAIAELIEEYAEKYNISFNCAVNQLIRVATEKFKKEG